MDRGAQQTTVHRVAESDMAKQLSAHTHTRIVYIVIKKMPHLENSSSNNDDELIFYHFCGARDFSKMLFINQCMYFLQLYAVVQFLIPVFQIRKLRDREMRKPYQGLGLISGRVTVHWILFESVSLFFFMTLICSPCISQYFKLSIIQDILIYKSFHIHGLI